MRRVLFAAALGLAAGGSCLFSTTPPERNPTDDGTSVNPHEVVVRGLVQLYDRTDHHYRNQPGWAVNVVWYIADRTGDGVPDVDDRSVVRSGNGGVYEVRLTDARLVAVEVSGMLCEVDLEGLDCCFDDPPCPPSRCRIWTSPRRRDVVPGVQVQQNLVVGCDHVP